MITANDRNPVLSQRLTLRKRLALLVLVVAVLPWAILARVYWKRHADHTNVAEPSPSIVFDKVAFPLSLSPDRRNLLDARGKPLLIQGEAAWSLIAQLTREDAAHYLRDRHRRGVNLIIVNLIEHWFANHPPQNVYGIAPFRVSGDFSTPNEQYFEYAREVVKLAAAEGIIVLLSPDYLGGDGSAEGWYEDMRRNGPDALRAYGRYVGQRFREFENIIWLNGGDFTPPKTDLVLLSAVAQGIRTESPRQLQTAHFSPETSALDVNMGFPLDLNTTYTYLPSYLKSLADYDHGSGPAHFLVESKYEYDLLGTTERSLRGQAYSAILTGAIGQVFGNRWIWQFTSPTLWNRPLKRNWRSALDSPMSRSMTYVRALFERLPWTTLVPDETYEVQLSGQGSKGSIDYPVLAWQREGRLAVAYVPTEKGIRVNLSKLTGPLSARWYDPTSGQYRDVTGSPIPASGERTFKPAGNNASGDSDWVLLLETARK